METCGRDDTTILRQESRNNVRTFHGGCVRCGEMSRTRNLPTPVILDVRPNDCVKPLLSTDEESGESQGGGDGGGDSTHSGFG